jgi:tetratricopeptide (TPR) repeat protein
LINLTAIQELRAAGRHEEARQRLIRLAADFPNNPGISYAAACVHDFLGLEKEAVPFYTAAIRNGLAGPDLRGAYLGLGSTYRALGQYEESKRILTDGLLHFPAAHELRVFLAMTLYNLSEYHAATALLLNVIADTTSDLETKGYERAIRFYAEDLDRHWD